MEKIKLMTIVGTRPEIIRLSAVIKKCDRYFNQLLVHTGQNYDYTLNQIFFEDLELRAPDFYLNAVGSGLGETIGNIIAKSYALMAQQKPDALLILGDTNSCLSAIAAKRLHIPILDVYKRQHPAVPLRNAGQHGAVRHGEQFFVAFARAAAQAQAAVRTHLAVIQ